MGAQIESGELDLEKIFFTDEGGDNIAAYVRKELKKGEMGNDLILRDDGTW